MTHTAVFAGQIVYRTNCEDDRLIGLTSLDEKQFLVQEIQDLIDFHGNFLTVRYWISDAELSKETLQKEFAKTVLGFGDVTYAVWYSETSGHLCTTQDLKIGGHDLLQEIESEIGRYLYLEIEFSRSGG